MADLIIPNDTGLVTSSWSLAGKSNPVTTTLGIHATDDPDPEAFLSEVYNGWTASGGFCTPSKMGIGWTFDGCTMIWRNSSGILEGYAYGDPVVGTLTSTPLILVSSTLLLQKRTARVGRHFRGRMYLPNMLASEATVDPMGNIESVTLGIVRDAVAVTTDFWDASDTWQPVLLHSDNTITPGYTPITSWFVPGKTATQRRRLRS